MTPRRLADHQGTYSHSTQEDEIRNTRNLSGLFPLHCRRDQKLAAALPLRLFILKGTYHTARAHHGNNDHHLTVALCLSTTGAY